MSISGVYRVGRWTILMEGHQLGSLSFLMLQVIFYSTWADFLDKMTQHFNDRFSGKDSWMSRRKQCPGIARTVMIFFYTCITNTEIYLPETSRKTRTTENICTKRFESHRKQTKQKVNLEIWRYVERQSDIERNWKVRKLG